MIQDNLITFLKLEELTTNVKPPLRSTEYIVLKGESELMHIQPHRLYRANYFGLMLVEEGCAYYSVGDFEYQVAKGDVLFCVPQEVFRLVYVSLDIRVRQIFFSIDMLNEAGFNYRSNEIVKSFSSNPSYIIRNEEDLYQRLHSHMRALEQLNDSTQDNYYAEEMIWHNFSLLMYEIDIFNRESARKRPNTSREEELTTAFFALVRDYYIDHHDVQYYADSLHVSRKYLSRIIKKTMAKSPKDIINQVLLIEAKILLRTSKCNVNEVAARLKFSDSAVFSKFFKKNSGIKPSEYRTNDLF